MRVDYQVFSIFLSDRHVEESARNIQFGKSEPVPDIVKSVTNVFQGMIVHFEVLVDSCFEVAAYSDFLL